MNQLWVVLSHRRYLHCERRGVCVLMIAAVTVLFTSNAACCRAAGMLYWGVADATQSASGVWRANADGTGVTELVAANYVLDVAVGSNNEGLFWTNHGPGGGILRHANLDGSNPQTIVTGLSLPWGVAISPNTQKVYWSDYDSSSIWRADFNGSNPEPVITGIENPSEIEIDPTSGTLYWADSFDGTIRKSNLNGGNITTLVASLPSGTYGFHGIHLDLAHQLIYWAEDFPSGKVRRANLADGSDITDITSGNQPASVTTDPTDGRLYWSDYSLHKIHIFDQNGGGDVATISTTSPAGLIFVSNVPEPNLVTMALFLLPAIACHRSRRKSLPGFCR